MKHTEKPFVGIEHFARAHGLPEAWVRREIAAGRIPAVRAGRRWLVHLERARESLAERAARGEAEGGAR